MVRIDFLLRLRGMRERLPPYNQPYCYDTSAANELRATYLGDNDNQPIPAGFIGPLLSVVLTPAQ